jgi:hypothetical protein
MTENAGGVAVQCAELLMLAWGYAGFGKNLLKDEACSLV